MFRSLHEKLLTLPDDTEIFPAHGAGSLCGRQMSSESSSTIGKQRQSNYALLARTSDEFMHLLTDNLPARPEYFARDADLNRRGAAPLSGLPPPAALTAPEVLQLQKEGAIVIDTRPAMQFAVDVREPGEAAGGVSENSLCIPLAKLGSRLVELERGKRLVVHCKGVIEAPSPPVFCGVPASAVP